MDVHHHHHQVSSSSLSIVCRSKMVACTTKADRIKWDFIFDSCATVFNANHIAAFDGYFPNRFNVSGPQKSDVGFIDALVSLTAGVKPQIEIYFLNFSNFCW